MRGGTVNGTRRVFPFVSVESGAVQTKHTRRNSPLLIGSIAAVVLIVVMALNTKVVKVGSDVGADTGAFSAETYGPATFPKVQAEIEKRAVEAPKLAAAIVKDRAAAAKQYGVAATAGAEMAVKFTGVAGKNDSGNYTVAVAGVPKTITVEVQTGPFISGQDLRDATGTIAFAQFHNQIEYQNAGGALIAELKKDVLSKVDTDKLAGKKISVVGAFALSDSDPNTWLVTPAKLAVQ
jgi:predicted lipoprotein